MTRFEARSGNKATFDYEKSLSKLSKRLAMMNGAAWSPTQKKEAALDLAKRLIALADDLEGVQWEWLEYRSDAPNPVGLDPCGGLTYPGADRPGAFKDTLWRLREMAVLAVREAGNLPDPRKKNELPFAAAVFLHIIYHCDKPFPPSLYDDSPAVVDLEKACQEAGIFKARGTLRNALSSALAGFDPSFDPYNATDFLVSSEG